jgi:hypothetical protein
MSFEGDIFETEDQRNWTDASFKTYSTPLELPFPVEVANGEKTFQMVALSVTPSREDAHAKPEQQPLTLTVGSAPARRIPKIGLCVASHGQPLSEIERSLLARLRLNHLRVDLHFRQSDWKERLRLAYEESAAIGSRLECALFLAASAEQSLLDFAQTINPEEVDLCLIFREEEKSTSSRSFEIAKLLLASRGFRLATGTNAYFAELNRQQPPRGATICYSLNPQVHAFDDLSLMETLEAQPATVESASQFSDEGIVISPITLLPRFNPNATAPPDRLNREPVDPRQKTVFAAAWTLGTLTRLLPLEPVESLTFFETIGRQGILERSLGSPVPDSFGSTPGEIFPVFYVFEALAGARSLHPVNVSDSRRIAGLACSKGKEDLICLLANLTCDIQNVEVIHSSSVLHVAMLDETPLPALLENGASPWRPIPVDLNRTSFALGPYTLLKLEFA